LYGLLLAGVGILAIGFITLILVLNAHLKHFRRELRDLRTYLIAILGDR
jgi:hypothetical protein